jgi:hypothetical protein
VRGYFVIAGEPQAVNEAIGAAIKDGFEPAGPPSVSATLVAADADGKPVIAVVVGQAMRKHVPIATVKAMQGAN